MKERIIRKKKEKHSSLLIFSISEIPLTASEQIQNIYTKNALIADYLCGSPCHLDIHLNNNRPPSIRVLRLSTPGYYHH